ncbi:MAG: tRNA (adenosine(37)-N6)-threonylcarbamoyltransferase complex dimerization subunit type 1 TsaB [Gemmatimonadales bacterium]|nr:tRNA (adenosine(37)-N6)-threonylcarbamoyltransferase complex dimerization subunit type 1 TsaB [Gemmatimonadales bacterium]NIN09854.1 tRNA (adenosine(37)-N6)-threonylcarbamoyltransferase complex dimerization subunit type 1 TsaB [Gemmatimonadales bacterium]NIN48558.1 tRNA (adenosine(37)-N6)-threonylcarbamoyltransferase complex dimerization subunit type 1 TsaB [Gemmatimonadales bacterium]NIP06022.1 tRNA (adenosine(37)-N6)-threonylcarbamoyltransferase complex dimerization subunit type 1 TsaB [Gem
MSLYLAIETATGVGSVAVGEPGAAASEIVFGDRRHAAALLPAIGETLRLAAMDYTDLAGIVVADGPGSFTGLRIGFATAKGILRCHDTLVLRTAPSLLAAAWSTRAFVRGPVAALYDALRGEVFAAVYDVVGDSVRTLVEPLCCSVSELIRRCSTPPAIAVGDGALASAEEVQRWTGRPPIGPPAGAPRASALIELLAVGNGTQPIEDPERFEPVYGRPAAAQARWEQEHGRALPHSGSGRR